jgi:ParB-like chromosome segregation protein Spo0J
VPAYIRIANDEAMLEMALVENIQREELDAIEVAISFQRLVDEVKLTQEQLSEKVGKDRTTVTNYLRLLKLPPEIQLGLRQRTIGMGHARALIGISDPGQAGGTVPPHRGEPAERARRGGPRPYGPAQGHEEQREARITPQQGPEQDAGPALRQPGEW